MAFWNQKPKKENPITNIEQVKHLDSKKEATVVNIEDIQEETTEPTIETYQDEETEVVSNEVLDSSNELVEETVDPEIEALQKQISDIQRKKEEERKKKDAEVRLQNVNNMVPDINIPPQITHSPQIAFVNEFDMLKIIYEKIDILDKKISILLGENNEQ